MKNTVNGIHACRTTSPCRGENSLPTERFFRIDRQDWNVNQKLFQDDAGGAKDPGTQLSPAGQSTAQPRLDFLRHDYAGDEKHHADCQKNVE